MNPLQKWFVSLALTAVLVVISYLWLDRPVSLLAHAELRHFPIFDHLTRFPEPFAGLAMLALVALGLRGLTGRPLGRIQSVGLLCALALLVVEAIKRPLKFAFGRTWPEPWLGNNPSLIRDNVYGFFPFHGGQGWASFPSGHTAAACAVIAVLWICYPRYRWLYALATAAVAVGLIGANYHFVGDVIAGGFVGVTVGWIAVALWEAGVHHPERPSGRR